VLGLVQRKLARAGDPHPGDQTEPLVAGRLGELDALGGQFAHGPLDVVTHQVELVSARPVGRVDPELRRRQREDEPAASRVHRRVLQHVPEERTGRVGLPGEDQGVHSGDHAGTLARPSWPDKAPVRGRQSAS
jgi:hypothetical protein